MKPASLLVRPFGALEVVRQRREVDAEQANLFGLVAGQRIAFLADLGLEGLIQPERDLVLRTVADVPRLRAAKRGEVLVADFALGRTATSRSSD